MLNCYLIHTLHRIAVKYRYIRYIRPRGVSRYSDLLSCALVPPSSVNRTPKCVDYVDGVDVNRLDQRNNRIVSVLYINLVYVYPSKVLFLVLRVCVTW